MPKRYRNTSIYSIVMDKDERIKELEEELQTTKEHLYTAPSSRKEYYEKNKEVVKNVEKKQHGVE